MSCWQPAAAASRTAPPKATLASSPLAKTRDSGLEPAEWREPSDPSKTSFCFYSWPGRRAFVSPKPTKLAAPRLVCGAASKLATGELASRRAHLLPAHAGASCRRVALAPTAGLLSNKRRCCNHPDRDVAGFGGRSESAFCVCGLPAPAELTWIIRLGVIRSSAGYYCYRGGGGGGANSSLTIKCLSVLCSSARVRLLGVLRKRQSAGVCVRAKSQRQRSHVGPSQSIIGRLATYKTHARRSITAGRLWPIKVAKVAHLSSCASRLAAPAGWSRLVSTGRDWSRAAI